MQMQGGFNANQYEPKQTGGGHEPANKIPFTITNVGIKENASKDGGFFEVEFTSQLGSIIHRYNIWNKSPRAVEISHGQLSALCRAVNIYNIDWTNEGAALRGGKGLMDVGYQKGEAPTDNNPDAKGYTELKKVYDPAGNEPGKAAQQPQTQQNPPQSQGGPTPQVNQGGGWGQAKTETAPPNNNAGGAWQPGGSGGDNKAPPWGNR